MFFRIACFVCLIVCLSSITYGQHTIRVGFVIDAPRSLSYGEQLDISEQIATTLEQSNHLTYEKLGVHLEQSFERFEQTGIEIIKSNTNNIVSQSRKYTQKQLTSVLDTTETDVVFFIFDSLGGACGSAEIPHRQAHFNFRFLVGTMKQSCINPDVFSHELGHLFGAHHDLSNDFNSHLITQDARGCIIANSNQRYGSLMSYASERTPDFSTPEFCNNQANNNRRLIIKKAPLLASMFERSNAKKRLGQSNQYTYDIHKAATRDNKTWAGLSDPLSIVISVFFLAITSMYRTHI